MRRRRNHRDDKRAARVEVLMQRPARGIVLLHAIKHRACVGIAYADQHHGMSTAAESHKAATAAAVLAYDAEWTKRELGAKDAEIARLLSGIEAAIVELRIFGEGTPADDLLFQQDHAREILKATLAAKAI